MSTFGIIALTHSAFGQSGQEVNGASSAELLQLFLCDAQVAIAAKSTGETGVLNLELADLESEQTLQTVAAVLEHMADISCGQSGIKYDAGQSAQAEKLLKLLADRQVKLDLVIGNFTGANNGSETKHVKALQKQGIMVVAECICVEEAKAAQKLGCDAVVAKGHEAGGRIGDDTTFVLLQKCARELTIPFFAHGGVGIHTAGACLAAGAAGVVLDSQLSLLRESPLSYELKQKVVNLDGTETSILPHEARSYYRVYWKNQWALDLDSISKDDLLKNLRERQKTGTGEVYLFGQDIAFAHDLAARYSTVAGAVQAIKQQAYEHLKVACDLQPLQAGAPLAVSHGTEYPIVQGAMTRVSDTADFARSVAKEGALPFLALALMRKNEVEALVAETKEKLGSLSWGVGILGFVPQQLRQEQLDVISKHRPPFALIAGGRPDQAKSLEEMGIATYLHVPSPMLLQSFIEMGSRRFIFEGKECGGHVGPRSSFILWEAMVAKLLAAIGPRDDASAFHVLFAGGVHDSLSAAMVSALAAPLASRGVRIGALMGTAYLFTEEAVSTGAIVKRFQKAAIDCQETVLLETGPGHAIRCIDSPYKKSFDEKRQQMTAANKSRDEIREELELMNLGRLRVASKGLTRPAAETRAAAEAEFQQNQSGQKGLTPVLEEQQWADGMYMIGQVAGLHEELTTVRRLHEDVSTGGCQRLQKLKEITAVENVKKDQPSASEPIAIIGMSCLFPKANDLETYWENILNKVDAITEVPADQWDWRNYYDPDPLARDKIYSKWGGFLEGIKFDPTKYGIPPSTLASIDPMQVLLLEVTRAAIEDAGYAQRDFSRERTSVILANAGHGPITALYSLRSMLGWKLADLSDEIKAELEKVLPEWTEDSFPGYLSNVTAGRVANRFDLGGVNFCIDAACASSLAALYVGMAELRNHNSDVVFLSASDTHNQPGDYLSFSKTHAFSAAGRCRTFDITADGIVISEGMAMVVLKRLEDAQRDGDRVYAVLRGIGGSSDGRDLSLTAPRPAGQMLALRRAYEDAGVEASTVSLVEAHGTGTVAGDKAEIEALKQVFEEANAAKQACAVGSVKTMIGHSKAAAGLASLIKVAKSLHHRVLPPTIGVTKPNPACRFEDSPFYINSEARPWMMRDNQPRRAGVSAFGFGGTNFHVVLEEFDSAKVNGANAGSRTWPAELFLLYSRSRSELAKACELLGENAKRSLATDEKATLRDLAQSLHLKQQDRRGDASSELCLSVVATSFDDLVEKLSKAKADLIDQTKQEIRDPKGIYFAGEGSRAPVVQGKVAFLFPGQGSQSIDMLKDVCMQFAPVRNAFERANEVLGDRLARKLSSYVYPAPAFDEGQRASQLKALTDTHVAQPAVGAADVGMYNLLKQFHIAPDMVAGHSYGEYVALYAAGILEESDLFKISEVRGRLLSAGTTDVLGAMAAVSINETQMRKLLSQLPGITLANINSPNQCVLSGDETAIDNALETFKQLGLSAKRIAVSQAFHSPHMEHAQKPLETALSIIVTGEPKIDVYCNTDAQIYDGDDVVQRLTRHIVEPVDFAKQIRTMFDNGARVFVEAGPGSVLSGLVETILSAHTNDRYLVVSTDRAGRNGVVQLLHALAQLAAYGLPVNISKLFSGRVGAFDLVNQLSRGLAKQSENGKRNLVYHVNSANIARIDESGKKHYLSHATTSIKRAPAASALAPAASALATAALSTVNSPSHKGSEQAKSAPTPAPTPSSSQPNLPSVSNNINQKEQTMSSPRENPIQQTQTPAMPPKVNPLSMPSQINALPVVASGRNVDQVMLQFQQTMLQMTNNFLQTQQQVMLAYLQNRNGAVTASFAPPPVATGNNQPVASALDYAPMHPAVLPAANQYVPMPPAIYPAQYVPQAIALPPTNSIDRPAPASYEPAAHLLNTLSQVEASAVVPAPVQRPEPPEYIKAQTPPPAADADPEFLVANLMDIVSQRTGYPIDMLDPTLDLEADLGIDSIKRVEILNTFRKTLPAYKQLELESGLEELAGTKTLEGIITWIRKSPAPAAPGNGNGNGNGNGHGNGHHPESSKGQVIHLQNLQSNHGNGNGHNGHDNNGNEALAQEQSVALRRGLVKTFELSGLETSNKQLNGYVLIAADGMGYARALVERLGKENIRCVVLDNHGESKFGDQWIALADLSASAAVAAITETNGAIAAFVDLRFFDIPSDCRDSNYLIDSFAVAKALDCHFNPKLNSGDTRQYINVVRMDGRFGQTSTADFSPLQAGLLGLTKSLAKEWGLTQCKTIDFAPEIKVEEAAEHLLKELRSAEKHVEIGYTRGTRWGVEVVTDSLEKAPRNALQLDASKVVLITGGARGITAEISQCLARQYQPKLIIVGRLPEPVAAESAATQGLQAPKELKAAIMADLKGKGEAVNIGKVESIYNQLLREREVRTNLQHLRQLGSQVEYIGADVRDVQAFGQVIDSIYEKYGTIDGVIHGAGVIEDAYAKDKTIESFQNVVCTKINGAFTLAAKLQLDRLDFFYLFSSVVGRTGNAGQTDYVAANETVNKLALLLDRRTRGRVASIMWGPWNGGMAPKELEEIFAKHGWAMIEPAAGRSNFIDELEYGKKGDSEVVLVAELGQAHLPEPRGPRLHEAQVSRPHAGSVEFALQLNPDHDLYLKDHTFDGIPVMPMAFAMEIMTEAAVSAYPEYCVQRVHNMDIPSGVVFDAPSKPVTILTEELRRSEFGVSVCVSFITSAPIRRTNFKCVIDLVKNSGTTYSAKNVQLRPGIVDRFKKRNELHQISDLMEVVPSAEEIYGKWLFHGPIFQGIRSIELSGADGIVGIVQGSSEKACLQNANGDRWNIDPVLFDSSMQLAGVWARQLLDITVLPTGFQTLHLFSAIKPGEQVIGRIYVRPETNARELTCDLAIYHESGEMAYLIEGLGGIGSKSLNRLASQAGTLGTTR